MSGSCETPQPQLCGCCQGTGGETPEPITNRSELSAISYRVGTHATFKASMLAALSDSDLPGLAPLRTRDASDFSIALLDAWATSLDILSFYQERLANESYLRTAVDSSSVMALAQLVGYKPSPGVAASTLLAFTLSSAPGSPDNVVIPAGSRVQSVPGPGQSPQVFETSSDLTALIKLNAIPPQTALPRRLNPGDKSVWIQGTSNNINVGDAILFVNQALHASATSGSASTSGKADFHFVTSVTIDSNLGNTLIGWDQPLQWPTHNDNTAYVYVFRKKAALFGVQAPDPRMLPSTNNNLSQLPGYPSGGNGDWSFLYMRGSHQINLDASYPGLAPARGGEPQWVLLVAPQVCTALFQIKAVTETGPVLYALTSKTTQLTLALGQVLVNHILGLAEAAYQKALTALHAAIGTWGLNWWLIWTTYSQSFKQVITNYEKALKELEVALGPFTLDEILRDIVAQTRSATAFIQSELLSPAGPPYFGGWSYDGTYKRQTGLLKPVEGSKLEIVSGQKLSSGQPVAVFGKRLRLQVSTAGQPSDSQAGFVPEGTTGSLALSNGQVFLVDAFPPKAAPNSKDQFWSVITTDGIAGTLEIKASNLTLIPADNNDPVVGETTTISQTSVLGPNATLSLGSPLARIYDRSTLTVNANVVEATQGETMNEILGSGDATNAALQFTLKQSPLTYVSSPLGMGAESTLQVWVNNLQWHEVDNFLDSAPSDRVFVTQSDATGKVTIQFGNGEEGARTPTGQMNIRAVYRKGIGAAGNVQNGQLSQPLDRPQGLKNVTNPDPATGGANPASADDARASAPLHVLTLDRVVSLEDYQNYALAFAGIAKALATWTWFGRTRGVFLTVAGADGTVFQSDDPTITNLKEALWNAGNPFIPLQVASYRPVLFEVAANVRIDQNNYDPTQVLGQAWQSLSTSMGFDQRQLGQGVAESELIALIQQTPGVIAVELTRFNRRGQPSPAGGSLKAVLRAASPIPGQKGTPQGAEMLILDPASQGNIEVWS